MNRNKIVAWLTVISLASLLVACAAPTVVPTETLPTTADTQGQLPATLDPDVLPTEYLPTLAPTASLEATETAPTETPAATTQASGMLGTPEPGTATSLKPTATLSPAAWRLWPIVPVVSPHMKEIYQKGLALGNDPHSFSKVGDCQNILLYYLSFYDNPGEYRLGQYSALQDTIDYYKGSFGRDSRAVRGGFNVASVLSPFWADPAQCSKEENPLACEFRIHQPSVAIISMETWWSGKPATQYEGYLRKIVEFSLAHGTVPILATKADNFEGDNSINAAIARVAVDYDVPLWNFWLAVQPLPNQGLSPDGFHLTFARPYFDDPVRMQMAWPVRNLTALQALDAVRAAVTK
jgi:hypothetical protein